MTFSKNTEQCRLCLNRFSNLTNVILQPEAASCDLTLPECISRYFGIEIVRSDKYTKMICANCLSLIQGISMYRRKFQELQKHLVPIVKNEEEECQQDDDSPPILEPYFSQVSQNDLENNICETIHTNRNVTNQETIQNRVSVDCRNNCNSSTNCDQRDKYIRVPKIFFQHMRNPRVQISRKERAMANSILHKNIRISPSKMRIKQMTNKYMHHGYSEGRPGVIRQLIQDRARKTMYVSEFDNNIKFKSIYEYDFNLKQKKNMDDDNLLQVDMQLNVFVCVLCNNVYNNQRQLDTHQEVHRKQFIRSICDVIS